MKQRSSNIDILKFISAIVILICHANACGANVSNPSPGHNYVDFFFIVTGFFTLKHYEGRIYSNRIKNSFEYTLKKFSTLIPYVVIITIIHYISYSTIMLLEGAWNLKDVFYSVLTGFVDDILLISIGWKNPLVGPLWFVASMFVVFPLFCFLLQLKNRYCVLALSFVSWYIPFSVGYGEHFSMLIYAFSNLCLGAVLYEVLYISEDALSKVNKTLLTVIEILAYAIPLVLTFRNIDASRFFIFSFFVCLLIMFSGLSYSSRINSPFLNYLGRLSLPIYMVQITVGEIIAATFKNSSDLTKLLLYYLGTIVIAILFVTIMDNSHLMKKIKSLKIEFKE